MESSPVPAQQQPQETTKTKALGIPCLPPTAPRADTPDGMRLPLMPHQERALHRCRLIEQDGSLSGGFNALPSGYAEYRSRGGVLADAVGTGKTATSIGLVLASEGPPGATLVVAPSHLIPQWKTEIRKFAPDIEVLVGKRQYESAMPQLPYGHRIVLVDIDSILNEDKLWYDFRRVYKDKDGKKKELHSVSRERMEEYKASSRICVQSPKGPCSYTGWIYIGSLHIPQVPWRRVIFDEIQDLVKDGTESQKNLLQLSRKAKNVWLLSATPFPHGNSSVYANHELLGFCRLRLNVEVDHALDPSHPFEIIKRKLYIRSPQTVADEAVKATRTVQRQTIEVTPLQVERQFYSIELQKARERSGGCCGGSDVGFGDAYQTLREMTVHPEASAEMRAQASSDSSNNHRVGQSLSVSSFARLTIRHTRDRLTEIERREIPRQLEQLRIVKQSLDLALKIKAHREAPRAANVFAANAGNALVFDIGGEAELIHREFCPIKCGRRGSLACPADRHANLRTIPSDDPKGREFIKKGRNGSLKEIIDYFGVNCHPSRTMTGGAGAQVPAFENYVNITTRTVASKQQTLDKLLKEKSDLKARVAILSSNSGSPSDDSLASAHGSKPAALVRYLRTPLEKNEKAIIFSMWHDTLRLIQRTLRKCNLECTFCDGNGEAMRRALSSFTVGSVNILLLSAQAKASGANLQAATHVILLDPPGRSAEHGAALEQQAVGRAVRMGQERPVTVTRFSTKFTLEQDLFDQIDRAAARASERANDSSYVIEGAHKKLPNGGGKRKVPKKDKTTDITVTESVTPSEKLKRQFESAKENGMVIDLLSSDDDDDQEEYATVPTKKARTAENISATQRCVVKTEVVQSEVGPSTTVKNTSGKISSSSPPGATGSTGEQQKQVQTGQLVERVHEAPTNPNINSSYLEPSSNRVTKEQQVEKNVSPGVERTRMSTGDGTPPTAAVQETVNHQTNISKGAGESPVPSSSQRENTKAESEKPSGGNAECIGTTVGDIFSPISTGSGRGPAIEEATTQNKISQGSSSVDQRTAGNTHEKVTKANEPPSYHPIPVGTLVQVEWRTAPGVNKPGGAAKVTAVHQADESLGTTNISYDVSFVLGRSKEKEVNACYVTLDEHLDLSSDNSGRRNRRSTRNRRQGKGYSSPVPSLLSSRDKKAARDTTSTNPKKAPTKDDQMRTSSPWASSRDRQKDTPQRESEKNVGPVIPSDEESGSTPTTSTNAPPSITRVPTPEVEMTTEVTSESDISHESPNQTRADGCDVVTPEFEMTPPETSEEGSGAVDSPNTLSSSDQGMAGSRDSITPEFEMTQTETVIGETSGKERTYENTNKGIASSQPNQEVNDLLLACGLNAYAEKFGAAGYIDLDSLFENASNVSFLEQLAERVGFKPGHAVRFLDIVSRGAQMRKAPQSERSYEWV